MNVCEKHRHYEIENDECVVCSALWDAKVGCPKVFMDFITDQEKWNEKWELQYKNGYHYRKGEIDAAFERIKKLENENRNLENRLISIGERCSDVRSLYDNLNTHRTRQIDENRKVSRKLDEILNLLSQASVQGKKCMECGEPKLRA